MLRLGFCKKFQITKNFWKKSIEIFTCHFQVKMRVKQDYLRWWHLLEVSFITCSQKAVLNNLSNSLSNQELTGCDAPPPPTLFGNYSVQSGVAFYVCAPRYMSADQSTATRCTSGSWPDPPACLPKTICQAGYPVRPERPPFATSLFNLFTTMEFTCEGVISSWEFYSRTKLPIRVFLSVWEPLSDRRYRMTGYNVLSINKAGKQTYEVPDGQQIPVYKGFIVGFAYDSLTNYEEQMVFTFYDQLDLGPYEVSDLFDGYTYPYTNQQLMAMSNGIIEFENAPQRHWRIPALRAVVTS